MNRYIRLHYTYWILSSMTEKKKKVVAKQSKDSIAHLLSNTGFEWI